MFLIEFIKESKIIEIKSGNINHDEYYFQEVKELYESKFIF